MKELKKRIMKKLKPKNGAGFSLIELLVTFSLISIVSGIGLASFSSYSRRQIVMQATADLKQAINLAKFDAVSSVKSSLCSADEDTAFYKVNFCLNALCQTENVNYETIVTCRNDAGIDRDEVAKSQKIAENLNLANITGGQDCGTVTFSMLNGTTYGIPCQIRIQGYGNQIDFSIDSAGHVTY